MTKPTTPPPSKTDRDEARQLVDWFESIDAIAAFAGEESKSAKENFAAHMLRNARLGLNAVENTSTGEPK